MKKILLFLLMLFIFIVSVNIFVYTQDKKITDVVWDNTFVNGKEYSSLSFEEFEKQIEDLEKELLNTVKTFKYEENIVEKKLSELNTKTNAKNIIKEIENFQSGNFYSKYVHYLQTKNDRKEYNLELKYDNDDIYALLKENFEESVIKNGAVTYSLKDNAIELSVQNSILLDYDKTIEDVKKEDLVIISTMEATPEINTEDLVSYLEKNKSKVETKAKDATLKFENGKMIVVDGYNGKTIDIEATKGKIVNGIKKEELLIPLVFKETEPMVKAEELQSRIGNINVLLGSFTTSYASSGSGRRHNVELAASKINGKVLAPNEVFSYNSLVAPVTSAGGYQTATVFSGGKAVPGIGGGICQVSSTLYNAVLYSNLEIVERHNHGLPVSYVKPSLDATVASGSGLDFRFKNTSGGYIYIRTTYGNGSLKVEIYGEKKDFDVTLTSKTLSTISPTVNRVLDTSLEKGTEKVTSSGANGYVSEAYIKVVKNGSVVREERLSKDTYRATAKEVHYNE